MVGACQVGREVACAEGWTTACRDNRGADDVADVEGAEDVAVDVVGAVVDAVDAAGVAAGVAAAVVVVAAGGAGRMVTCWDSSVGRQRQSEVLACKTGQDRWNIQRQRQIAIGSVSVIESASGVTVPATAKGDGRRNGLRRGGLACLRRRMAVAVVAKKGQVRARVRGEVKRQVLRRPGVLMKRFRCRLAKGKG